MESTEDLAKRVVRSKHWRWMPGMLTDVGERVTDPDICCLGTLPDLTDPPTLGGLLSLIRAAWRDQTLAARFDDEHGHWAVDGNRQAECSRGPTEVEALVAALEAAP